MTLLLLTPAALATAALACPSLDAEVERATTALLGGDFPAARAALTEANTSFGCAAATPSQLARYWLAEGAAAQLAGDPAAARAPLAAARRLAPALFDRRLGPDIHAAWVAADVVASGTLQLDPPMTAFLDGVGVAEWPAPVAATPHLVQIVGADGSVRFSRLIRVAAAEDALLVSGLGPETPSSEIAGALAPVAPAPKKSPALLVVAGVAAAGAGAFAGGALAQGPQLEAAGDTAALDAAFARQRTFGYGTYGLAGAAVAAFTLHFVLP